MSPSSRSSRSLRPQPQEVARVTSEAAELLEVLWGRASTAPVSASQLRVLFILEHNEGINLRTLADHLGSTPPSTSRLCDRLQAVGFVERRAAANSRRELQLFLSRHGRAFLTDLRARRESALQAVLEQMPAAQRDALLRGLEAFCAAAAEQIHEPAGPADAATA
ncbi:MarR family winged helix-turn-helix transcriptional regulator [Streptomyces griseoruber]|uniref:MarR family winged helix-turn-helix transcriptional regulator n=1 Tax=Streptomyces griseoruber TaxID=1943 RepID=UPI001430059D|nr:MarR family transcriptional regulator [Streptomyces griseoruber]